MLSLSRFLTESPPREERCEICATDIGETHAHLVDVRHRRLLCACRPCYLLFVPSGAAQGRYLAVGERYAAAGSGPFDDLRWEALQIPIGLAFFFYNSLDERVVGFYPGPAGATESTLPLGAWEDIARESPLLASLRPDVEAALVYRRKDGSGEAYVVPIDACYELVGIVRTTWQGFDGGSEAHERIDAFFDSIRKRCR